MRWFVAMSCAAVLAAGCSSAETPGGSGAAPSGAVTISDFAFDPETATVAAGEEVTWTVADGASPHTVKFDDEESKELDAGASYSRSFDKAGEYAYVCGIHPQMTGAVSVR